jgi:hypothetical protein
MGSTYKFCCRAMAAEAALLLATGVVAGVLYQDWRDVVAFQALLVGSAAIGHRIESYWHRRRSVEGQRW